ncbi:hypothetical protein BH10BDE1_BH10BDE1_23240 [soil metagenome]
MRKVAAQVKQLLGFSPSEARLDSHRGDVETQDEKSLILEGALDAVVGVDENNLVIFWNRRAHQIFGWTKLEIVGRDMTDLIIPERFRQAHRSGIKRFIQSGIAVIQNRRVEISGLRKSGEEFSMELTVSSIKGPGGYRFYSFMRDVSEIKRDKAQSEEELRTLANSIPQLAWMANPDGDIFWYNERWYDYTGSRIEDMRKEGWKSVHDPDMLPEVVASYQRTLTAGVPGSMEFPLRGKDGIYRWFLTRWVPVKDSAGAIVRWFGTNTDITAIREAQKSLEQAVQQRTVELTEAYSFVESILENIPNMIFVKDAKDLRFVRFNRAGENLIGRPKADLLGKNDFDLFPAEEARHFQAKDREVLKNRITIDIAEEEISTATGETRILHTKKIPVLAESGEARYLVGISEDITERKKLETERLEMVRTKIEQNENARTSERLKFLSDATSTLVSSLELESILSDLTKICVPTLADWCSVQLVQPDGKLKQLAVNHEDPQKVKWAWELHRKYPPPESSPSGPPNVLRTGQSELATEVPTELIQRSAQSAEHLQIIESLGLCSYICVPIKIGGNTIGTLSLVTSAESGRRLTRADLQLAEDLCHRAAIAVDKARLYREAKLLNQVKDEFLATLSHELRTPINVIQGRTDLLLTDFDQISKAELLKSLTVIQRNTRLQTQIVSDLLDVSSIITGKITYVPQVISPVETLKNVSETIRATAESKGVSLKIDIAKAPESILADPTRLHQILWNLLNNAIKFTSAGGQVSITLSQQKDDCVFKVDDTGMGIDPQFLPYIFDRFRQADSTMSRSFGGLGLGLSIVKSLAEIHGGQVSVASGGKGHGASFTVSLPIKTEYSYNAARSDLNEFPQEPEPETAGSLAGLTILVVEDSADNRDLIAIFLERKGARLLMAESAMQARQLLETNNPDLILSDIGMPEENGLDFIRRHRSEHRERFIPAVALTAYVRPQEIEAAFSAGFQGHIAKPVTAASLVSGILNVLDKSKKH